MKKSAFVLFLLILGLGLPGCEGAAPSQSTFKANFSLDSIAQANQQYLLEKARVSSGAEVGSREQFIQKYEEMTLRIDPAKVPAFMAAIRTSIEQALLDAGADVQGSQVNGDSHFSFSYRENDLYGTVHVWGVPADDTSYTIILMITEK